VIRSLIISGAWNSNIVKFEKNKCKGIEKVPSFSPNGIPAGQGGDLGVVEPKFDKVFKPVITRLPLSTPPYTPTYRGQAGGDRNIYDSYVEFTLI
jgi:hypothetical protein